ncbi:MAG: phosphoenolpyruvate carboxykinase (ATP), partial [Myxococcota bacterium]
AAALTLQCSPNIVHRPSMDQLYTMASQQPSTIVSDVTMADATYAGLSPEHNNVLVSYTGQDTARSAWARLVCPQPKEIQRHPHLLNTRDRIERLVREINFQLMHQQTLIHTEVFFGKNKGFMGKIHLIVPSNYAKLAFDLNLNFIRMTPDTQSLYEQSQALPLPDIWLVCQPDWVNPSWHAWRSRVMPVDQEQIQRDPEPKRIMMVFDTECYTSYLLGARYFGEIKKACLTMIWNAAIQSELGMPIHGSSKTIFVRAHSQQETAPKHQPLQPSTFITIGLSGSGKSTIGNSAHEPHLDPQEGESIHIGNDDALVILYNTEDPQHGTLGLEDGCYNKSNDYTHDSDYLRTVQSAENVMIHLDPQRNKTILHQDVFSGNGRVQTARHLLYGADQNLDTPHPNFICLLMKDETLPPVARILDPQLMVSMYMCISSRSTSAENIPVEQMGKLKMIPGANPFNTWGMEKEAEAMEKLMQTIGCEGIIMNTGSFFIDAEQHQNNTHRKITKDISLSIYPKLAKQEIKWVPWKHFPGVHIPQRGCFDHVHPEFDQHFHPEHLQDEVEYCELLRSRLIDRVNFLLEIKIDRRFVLPIRKAIFQLDAYELQTRGPVTHVENLETIRDTGREETSF